MKILHLSDIHGHQDILPKKIFEGVDVVVVSGDVSNYHETWRNEQEVLEFIEWYEALQVPHKLWCAGNHDGSIERGFVRPKDIQVTTSYLEDQHILIDGVKFWFSPWTPTFGSWYYMMDRSKLHKVYDQIDNDTDVVVQHGPPRGILDLSRDRAGAMEFCGCKAFRNAMQNRVKPKLVLFGHIHNYDDIVNQGVLVRDGITYSNASIVTDGKFGQISSTGNLLEV